MAFDKTQFAVMLFGLDKLLKRTARKYPHFAERLREKNFTSQIKLMDNSQGRYFVFENGKVRSKAGLHDNPDMVMSFRSAELAVKLMRPNRRQLDLISSMKTFNVGLEGPDEITVWFSETLNMMMTAGVEYGVDLGSGVMRYTNNTNGGPVFVYVKRARSYASHPLSLTRMIPNHGLLRQGVKNSLRRERRPSPLLHWRGNPWSIPRRGCSTP